MTPPHALDTNGYVELLRQGPRAEAVRAFAASPGARFVLLMPVMAELLQGARTPAEERTLTQRLLEPVPPGRRVAAGAAEWLATGRLAGALARAGHDPRELARRAFYLDLHIAVLCRARGITLLSDDSDHARIRPYAGHRVLPLPS